MNRQLFQRQMERLAETFGAAHYRHERIEIIWREVKDLPDAWFTKTVDKFIGECATAPLMPKFREEIANERERNWNSVKEQERKETQQFLRDSYSNEEKQTICEMIRRIGRGNGEVEELDKKNFISMLENAANSRKGGQ